MGTRHTYHWPLHTGLWPPPVGSYLQIPAYWPAMHPPPHHLFHSWARKGLEKLSLPGDLPGGLTVWRSAPPSGGKTKPLVFPTALKEKVIYFRARRREEKERERNSNVWLPFSRPLLGTWPATLCPDWESIQQTFSAQAGVHSTEPHQPGLPPAF